MPNLSRSSAAIRSSPQVTLLADMSAISFCRSAGIRGRPRALDFHIQNSRKPFRCQRIKVSGLTTVRASRHANNLESNTRVNLADAFARRGLTLRSRYKANCLRRKRFSAANVPRAQAVPDEAQGIQQEIEYGQQYVGQEIEFRHQGKDRIPRTLSSLQSVDRGVRNYCGRQRHAALPAGGKSLRQGFLTKHPLARYGKERHPTGGP